MVAFRKNLIEMAELEIKHAKVSSTVELSADEVGHFCGSLPSFFHFLMKFGGFNTHEKQPCNYQ